MIWIALSILPSGRLKTIRHASLPPGNWSYLLSALKVKMAVSPDFKDLLRLFNRYRVKYLIVGGYAVIKYTEPRYTKDLDLWTRADAKNADAVYQALKAFGAPLENLTADDFAHEGYFYQMGMAPVRVDILMSITGVTFEEAWPRRAEVDFDGVQTFFISLEDLIASKQALGRPQDLIDVALYGRSKRETKRNKPASDFSKSQTFTATHRRTLIS
ncbi:MAG: DUF6036 family nucleotidyltransferase [Rhodothermales bacterium]